MAHLLLMYQYLRTKREVNKLTLRQIKASRRKDRLGKNIERVQKMYAARIKNVENNAKALCAQSKTGIQTLCGLGANDFNPYNYGGMTTFVAGLMNGILSNQDFLTNHNLASGIDIARYQQAYIETGGTFKILSADGTESTYPDGITEAGVNAYRAAMYQAQQQQAMQQQMCNQMISAYENNVSIWQDAQIAALEEEQDAALSPLEFEQTMWELEEETTATELEKKKQDMQNYKEALAEAAKDSAVSFGLA